MGIDNKLRSKNRRTFRYFLTDHLGSTEALANASGAIVSSTSYDSFGSSTSNIATHYRYTGREYDADTGLYYYRNRWYDPETGRFISKDPIGFAGGDINLYGYVGNNPLSFVDPFGKYACDNQKRKRQKGGYPGGDYNKIAQLAPCLKLNVPGFGTLPKVARKLLENTFGKIGALIMYEWNFSNYEKAVFVNTVVAAAGVGADLSSAKFLDFYRADFNYENGIYVDGLGSKGTTEGRHKIGGSVEFEREKKGNYKGKIHIDVDLYHPKPRIFSKGFYKHIGEWWFNKKHKRGTHPGDVVKRNTDSGWYSSA